MTAIAPTDKDRATEFAAAVRERLSDLTRRNWTNCSTGCRPI